VAHQQGAAATRSQRPVIANSGYATHQREAEEEDRLQVVAAEQIVAWESEFNPIRRLDVCFFPFCFSSYHRSFLLFCFK
jgi:hypothetical protein